MSRKVDLSKPLSEEDEAYLRERGRLADIARANGTEQGTSVPGGINGVNTGGSSPTVTDPRMGARHNPADAPTLQAGDGAKPLEDPDSATVKELQAEIDRRNEGRSEEDRLARTGTKQELIDRLEADDAE